mgnify:CR=1 FL=1
MSTVTNRLIVDATTGKKNDVIAYQSDADAMPMEHEQDHKRIVDTLIEGGALSAADLGEVVIERDQPSIAKEEESEAQPQVQRQSLSEDS